MDCVFSHAVGLCRWEGRLLWRAFRFTIGRAFTGVNGGYMSGQQDSFIVRILWSAGGLHRTLPPHVGTAAVFWTSDNRTSRIQSGNSDKDHEDCRITMKSSQPGQLPHQ